MKRPREAIPLFGMSFLDLLACALGAVVFLLMQTTNRTHELARAYDVKIAGLDRTLTGYEDQLAAARGQLERANRQTADALHAKSEAEKQRDAALEDRRIAVHETEQADRARGAAERRAGLAEQEAAKTRQDRDRAVAELADARRQLGDLRGVVGLKGPLRNMVFVFDTSASLARSNLPTHADPAAIERDRQAKLIRFEEYKALLTGWIRALGFDSFNLLSFNTEPHIWQANKLLPATPENREKAVAIIAGWSPSGTTNTMEALQQALTLPDVDTVVLFSDGQPNDQNNEPVSGDPQTAAERARSQAAIQRVMRGVDALNVNADGSRRITINAVAMGDYLDKTYGRFLQELARQNDGEFIGR